jgi:transposase
LASRQRKPTSLAEPRRAHLASLYERGLSNREIALELGVSGERVRQLLQRYEIAIVPVRERRYRAAVKGRETEVVEAFLELRSDAAAARTLELDERHVRWLVDATVPEADVLRRKRRRHRPRHSDEELVATLRRAALDLPSPMGYHAFRDWGAAQTDGLLRPGPQVVALRFDGWRRALVRAGLPVNQAGGPHPTYSLDDVLGAVAAAWRDLGRAPSVAGYEAWRGARSGLPAPATARRLGESWDDLLAAAYPLVYGPGTARALRPTCRPPAR